MEISEALMKDRVEAVHPFQQGAFLSFFLFLERAVCLPACCLQAHRGLRRKDGKAQ